MFIIPADTAKYYQGKAVNTVFDSLALWNIIAGSAEINPGNLYHKREFGISRIYPNPANESTQIDFWIGKSNRVSLCICDSQGKILKTVMNCQLSKGNYTVRFDVDNFPCGLFYVQLKYGTQTQCKKIAVQK
jgi:hypothetical protein